MLLAVSYFANKYFLKYMLTLSSSLSFEYEMEIFDNIRKSSFLNFRNFGSEKVYSLMEDTRAVSEFPGQFIQILNSAILLLLGITYLFILSFNGAMLILTAMFSLALIYFLKIQSIHKYLDEARTLSDVYHVNIRDLISGFKEIKMDKRRSDNIFFKHLNTNRQTVKEKNLRVLVSWLENDLLGRYCWFIVIGIILFFVPALQADAQQDVKSFIVILLFLTAPINELISFIPSYSKFNLAIDRLEDFKQRTLTSESTSSAELEQRLSNSFQRLAFKNIGYSYYSLHRDSFHLQVDSLEIDKGDIIFITGGNGSGKSTFLQLLIGLIYPDTGHLYYNTTAITQENSQFYRNNFAVIFSDNHLFSEDYDEFKLSESDQKIGFYTEMVKLTGLLRMDNKSKLFETKLSAGQLKRLAMIYALLENKEIIVLDEWAAEQDSLFKRYFYAEFLPKLKSLGKTVILVTHDDEYFHYADRVLRFEYGSLKTTNRH